MVRGLMVELKRESLHTSVTDPLAASIALLELSARDYGVLWTPMSFFYLNGGGRHAIRLSCSALVPDQIDEGVRRLAALIADVRS
jgi:(S)-3,5-dihydroxyphenylglycine transaminase